MPSPRYSVSVNGAVALLPLTLKSVDTTAEQWREPRGCQAVDHAGVRRLHACRRSSDGRLGLVLHPRSDPTPVVDKITGWARSHGKQVIADARDAARLPGDLEAVSAG